MRRRGLAAALALPLLLSAPNPVSAASRISDASVVVATCHLGGPITPATVSGVCGGDILDALFTGLVQYDPATSAPRYAVASAITTRDNRHFRIRLRKDWTFHDGTTVKARNFVNAWKLAGKKSTPNSYLFTDITATKVIDDRTFTVTLRKPSASFVSRLGWVAFFPLPDSTLKNPASLRTRPIGNGPFKVVSWAPGRETVVARYDGYKGAHPAQVGTITFRTSALFPYDDLLGGSVDVTTIPEEKIRQAASDLSGRVVSRPGATAYTLNFPMNVKQVSGNAYFRRAISMAFDRKKIVDKVFNGTRVPASSFVPPIVYGSSRNPCGKVCAYDPAAARKMLAKAARAGFRAPTTLPLYFNVDGAHGEWTRAVAADITRTFKGRIKAVAVPTYSFSDITDRVEAGKLNGLFRAGWLADYPHIEDFIAPPFRSDGSANYGHYRSAAVDRLVDAANHQVSPAKAIAGFRKAERLVLRDMPAIPLWFDREIVGYSETVTGLRLSPYGWVLPWSIAA